MSLVRIELKSKLSKALFPSVLLFHSINSDNSSIISKSGKLLKMVPL